MPDEIAAIDITVRTTTIDVVTVTTFLIEADLVQVQQVLTADVTPLIADGLIGAMTRAAGTAPDSAAQLTDRQREVVKLLAKGHSMKEVGAILNIVPRTVAFHKYRIMEMLHLRTSAELVQFAVKHRIV